MDMTSIVDRFVRDAADGAERDALARSIKDRLASASRLGSLWSIAAAGEPDPEVRSEITLLHDRLGFASSDVSAQWSGVAQVLTAGARSASPPLGVLIIADDAELRAMDVEWWSLALAERDGAVGLDENEMARLHPSWGQGDHAAASVEAHQRLREVIGLAVDRQLNLVVGGVAAEELPDLARSLVRAGYRVTVVAHGRSGALPRSLLDGAWIQSLADHLVVVEDDGRLVYRGSRAEGIDLAWTASAIGPPPPTSGGEPGFGTATEKPPRPGVVEKRLSDGRTLRVSVPVRTTPPADPVSPRPARASNATDTPSALASPPRTEPPPAPSPPPHVARPAPPARASAPPPALARPPHADPGDTDAIAARKAKIRRLWAAAGLDPDQA